MASLDRTQYGDRLSFSEMGTHDDADAFEHSLPDPAPSAESVFGLGEDTHRLEAALMKLPLIYREIVLFHYREGLTLEETAQTLKIPLNTAKSRDRRALIALRKLLATQ